MMAKLEEKATSFSLFVPPVLSKSVISRHIISVLLTIVGLILLAIGLTQSELKIGDLGLIHSFSPVFFIAISFILIAFLFSCFSPKVKKWLLYLQLFVIIFALYLTPFLLEGTPRFGASFWNYGAVEYLLREGHLAPSLIVYHNWPGFAIQFTALLTTIGIENAEFVMGIFPFFAQSLYVLCILSLFKNVQGKECSNMAWLTALMFTLGNWTNQNYFSPQGLAYVLFLCILWVILQRYKKNFIGNTAGSIILFVAFGALVITHALTAIMLIAVLVVLAVFHFFKYKTLKLENLLILFIVIFGAWILYAATTQFAVNLPLVIQEALRLDLLFGQFTSRVTTTSVLHGIINKIRISYSGVFFAIAFLSFILSVMRKKWQEQEKVMTMLAIAIALFIPLFFYGGEVIERAMLFSLIPVAYFITTLIIDCSNGKHLPVIGVAVALVIAIPCYFVATYGNEVLEYTRPDELFAANFYYSHATSGSELGFDPVIGYKRQEDFKLLPFYVPGKSLQDIIEENSPDYVLLNEKGRTFYTYIVPLPDEYMNTAMRLRNQPDYGLVYSNPDANVYHRRG